jgi:hypothetical protein
MVKGHSGRVGEWQHVARKQIMEELAILLKCFESDEIEQTSSKGRTSESIENTTAKSRNGLLK